jgi:hypothetical protein
VFDVHLLITQSDSFGLGGSYRLLQFFREAIDVHASGHLLEKG